MQMQIDLNVSVVWLRTISLGTVAVLKYSIYSIIPMIRMKEKLQSHVLYGFRLGSSEVKLSAGQ